MKRLARIPGLKIWTLLLLMTGSLGSCDILEEEAEDCAVYVRFKYDMNMEFADAFQRAQLYPKYAAGLPGGLCGYHCSFDNYGTDGQHHSPGR